MLEPTSLQVFATTVDDLDIAIGFNEAGALTMLAPEHLTAESNACVKAAFEIHKPAIEAFIRAHERHLGILRLEREGKTGPSSSE